MEAFARNTDPQTSHDAAARVSEFFNTHFEVIKAALKIGDGTIYDIAGRCDLDHVQVARMMSFLERVNVATTTGETRPSPRGRRQCRVWRLV